MQHAGVPGKGSRMRLPWTAQRNQDPSVFRDRTTATSRDIGAKEGGRLPGGGV